MRSKNAKRNTLTGLANELVVIAGGLILPRLILSNFGSAMNGLVSSIVQFMGFSVVFYAGLGAVTRRALYKPLADKEQIGISEILVATERFMKKTAIYIGIGIFLFACIYPFFVIDQFDWFSTFLLVLIIGASSFADSYFGITYRILLQADQKYYIQTLFNTITYTLSTVTSIVLILTGQTITVVRLGATLAFFINPLLVNLYVRKHYKLDKHAVANEGALTQRADAFTQQVAGIVGRNVDIALLTIFLTTNEISVYTVHFMVINNIGKLINSCVNGMGAIFGNMMAKNEKKSMNIGFYQFEWLLFAVAVIFFSVTSIMITPFVEIYTRNIIDVNYHRPLFAFLLTAVAFFACLRLPYQIIVEAAGHFKQTRNGAIVEVVLNIVFSIVFLQIFGITGVVVGSLIATAARTIQYSFYSAKYILDIHVSHITRMYVIYGSVFILLSMLQRVLTEKFSGTISSWAMLAGIVFVMALIAVVIISFIFNRSELIGVFNRLRGRRRTNAI